MRELFKLILGSVISVFTWTSKYITGKPLLTRFLLRQIQFDTNYNLQPCPPIARLNFDLTQFFKIKCGQKYDLHPSNTCHTV